VSDRTPFLNMFFHWPTCFADEKPATFTRILQRLAGFSNLSTILYRNPRYTECYLHFKSDHPLHVKREVVYSSVNRAKVMCHDRKNYKGDIRNIKYDLMLKWIPTKLH
jgi:hypothetical protein